MNKTTLQDKVSYLYTQHGYNKKSLSRKLGYSTTHMIGRAEKGKQIIRLEAKIDALISKLDKKRLKSLSASYNNELEQHFTGVDSEGNVTHHELYGGSNEPRLIDWIIAIVMVIAPIIILFLISYVILKLFGFIGLVLSSITFLLLFSAYIAGDDIR